MDTLHFLTIEGLSDLTGKIIEGETKGLSLGFETQFDLLFTTTVRIGNIIGSNIFNLLGVLGIAAAIESVALLPIFLARDFPAMFLMTGALYLMASDFHGPGRIGRRSGSVLLLMFIGYSILVWMSSGHVSLEIMG